MRIFVLRLLPLLVLPLAACAPLTENERYESENRLILVKEQYAQRAESCESHGGSMKMQARAIGQPDYFDYRSAQCVRY
jgi:hypothetical protein